MLNLDFINLKSNQIWNQTKKSPSYRQKNTVLNEFFQMDSEEDDRPLQKTSKAPPVISFPDSADSELRNRMCSMTKNQECNMKQSSVAKKRVEEPLKKISNPNAIKKHKLFENISGIVKKQADKIELASASRLKQKLSLQKCNTSMKLDKFLKQISTEISHESVKTSFASPSVEEKISRKGTVDIISPTKQNTSRREARKKFSSVTSSKECIYSRKPRAHSTPPSSSK